MDDAEKDCGKTNCSRRNQAVVGMPNNAFRNEMATLLYSQFNNEFEFGSSIPGTKIRLARRASHSYGQKAKVERPKVPRFMRKNGHCNIRQAAQDKREKYMSDLFTTFVDLDWMYSIALFIGFYAIIWVIFSFLYWVVAYVRGDLDYWNAKKMYQDIYYNWSTTLGYSSFSDRLTFQQAIRNKTLSQIIIGQITQPRYKDIITQMTEQSKDTYKPCFENVRSYATAFLFFIETETTVGYGRRAITDQCPEAIGLLVIQCLLGTIVDAVLVGCIFIKISKPKNRTDTLIFSEKAVIAQRDGKYCFMFRVGNLRNSLIVQCKIRAKFVRSRQTDEGEFIPLDQTDINIGFDTGADKLFLVTPLIVYHEINCKSPFWRLSEADIQNEPFEIIVILEGTIESTGMICQARTSYLNREIQWGYRFMPMLFLDRHHFSADHSMFHSTYEVRMPVHSAYDATNPEKLVSKESELKHGKTGSKGTLNGTINANAVTSGYKNAQMLVKHAPHVPNSDSASNCTSNCISSDTVNLLNQAPTAIEFGTNSEK